MNRPEHKQHCDLHGVPPQPGHTEDCYDTLFGDYDYVECTCNLEARLVQWRAANRAPNAAPLPRAIVVRSR